MSSGSGSCAVTSAPTGAHGHGLGYRSRVLFSGPEVGGAVVADSRRGPHRVRRFHVRCLGACALGIRIRSPDPEVLAHVCRLRAYRSRRFHRPPRLLRSNGNRCPTTGSATLELYQVYRRFTVIVSTVTEPVVYGGAVLVGQDGVYIYANLGLQPLQGQLAGIVHVATITVTSRSLLFAGSDSSLSVPDLGGAHRYLVVLSSGASRQGQ